MKRLLLFSLLIISVNASAQMSIADLGVEVSGTTREFAFTNKQTASYYGETNAYNKTGWQGFNVFGHEFLDDYEIRVDGELLDRSQARTIVYPDYLKRIYPNGVEETLRPADSLATFSISVTTPRPSTIAVLPYFANARSVEEFVITRKTETALIARTDHQQRTRQRDYPVWLCVYGKGFLPEAETVRARGSFSPFTFTSVLRRHHRIFFAVGDTKEEAERIAHVYASRASDLQEQRRDRMQRLLDRTHVETNNEHFNKALAWAKLSLDALIMNQVTKGIFAGLPWFNNYWGRDTFISLPGATLVQGHFTEAREILRSFAAFQQRDSISTDWGRIPNIVTTTDKAYNTADGTPRFVMTLREYVERSGDTLIMKELYPVVIRSIEGTLKYHSDTLGFLTHGDAETWMDAVGPNGPWSPRGNRANDIQALWAQQLDSGIWFATQLGDAASAARWNAALVRLRSNFPRYFIHSGRITDHLNADGSHDTQTRPNQIFTTSLLDGALRASIVAEVTSELTYPYGVASLSQDDENFHPYHQNEPLYPKDAAYHNGTVWTWVQGTLISELCYFGKQDLGWNVTENSIHQILNRGAVGTQSELIDAIARLGEEEPRLSGTFSQAWNLAEFIRNFYDDYLGVRVSMLQHHLVLRPRLPSTISSVRATINLNGRGLPIEIRKTGDTLAVTIEGTNLRRGGTASLSFLHSDGTEQSFEVKLPPGSIKHFTYIKGRLFPNLQEVSGNDLKITKHLIDGFERLGNLQLATPKLHANLKSLKGPDHPLLSNSLIKADASRAKTILIANDPEGDDAGVGAHAGRYTYPANPVFVAGAFDIRAFEVRTDDSLAYFGIKFAALSNPGWHPEYGFQLTYVAIAIDTDRTEGSGGTQVGHNANYTLPSQSSFERLILVGGGLQVEDDKGKILAAYVPTQSDAANPLGDAATGTISFALPLRLLGKPAATWNWTILAGAQDDHGGAGLGEFRTVNSDRGEWNGGGRQSPDAPNAYDELLIRR